MPFPTRWHGVPAAARLAIRVAALAALSTLPARALEPRVPYVPTPQDVVERMLEIAKVGPHDYLIDLGCGDGRIVVTAARKYGTRGFGVDLDPARVRDSTENARRAGVADKVAFYLRDLFETKLGDATVITMYLLPQVNIELRPRLLELKPGTRLVSHDFDMGDWKPDNHVKMDTPGKYGGSGGLSEIYFWVVPARVAGVWRWKLLVSGKQVAYEVNLEQKFQTISGSAAIGGRSVKLQHARLRGDAIRFSFTADVNGSLVKHEFSGKVAGQSVTGSARLSGARFLGQLEWNAQRVAQPSVGTLGHSSESARAAHFALY